MTFPLMQGYDHINVAARLDPVAAVRDRELGERILRYPKLFPVGSPDFGHAVQYGDEWRIGSLGADEPSAARYHLAFDLRTAAADEPDPATARAMTAAAARLDPEEGEQLAKDEWEIGDRRYRIVRAERFILLGDRVMEPPRSTDADLTADALLRGHLIDPPAPCGQWEAQLRLNLVCRMPAPGSVPDLVRTEARHAIQTHPAVVLLPPAFLAVEIEDGGWAPLTGGDTPDDARDRLARRFTGTLPRLREFEGDPPSAAELAEWTALADGIRATKGHEFHVLGRRFQTVRVGRMLRLGRDGPESPRPSDQERYGLTTDA
ncbi:hypothetical protein E1293_14355 [Actinomadura darangshiensis]|uniref:PE-PGRS family protein n=1 Tax=Actinomadura darangshiensis TaxID=705336 RepID=A0A4R5BB03_9ACTN|nr:DUF5954 family protein [Actinomadura darangshiensis]TDD83598.1 hypothetical protein E1293_14355 [Actinomadura darangshiensis]